GHRAPRRSPVHPPPEGRPTAPVPFGNVVGADPARCPEIAPSIQVTTRRCQRTHGAVYPRTEHRPVAPIPFGNGTGLDPARLREMAARVKVTPRHRQRRDIRSVTISASHPRSK